MDSDSFTMEIFCGKEVAEYLKLIIKPHIFGILQGA